ncbi:7-carboxy-7-deazaguanine synthase QueE [Streptomyces katsurahamanus]|uniref:7-carboxy-7-deazaguanine synthase n=1 Tax=Streptomyces katsurahamanus TaxID=2577098 RepID=A0ABW9NYA6_9ACTN|nr:7-carboxy-7-deazaguanine synthase QueE [Streptomyces katsurahamanus]MQS38312.1 7-carboxy-7-deazaguanine synthase QueE [Streptomyces katsurahamanus]
MSRSPVPSTPAREDTLPVQEIFGPVPQGEGPYTGRAAVFVRLGRCNLHCPPCDSKLTWDTSRYDLGATCPPRAAEDIVAAAVALGAGDHRLTVISGGEPLLWQRTRAWEMLLTALPGKIHVESNGTISPTGLTRQRVAHFSVSPKTGAMGAADPAKRRIVPSVLADFARLAEQGRAIFKFVAGDLPEVEEIAELVRAHGLPQGRVWVMPLGDSAESWETAGRAVVERVMEHGFHFSGRLHLALGVR